MDQLLRLAMLLQQMQKGQQTSTGQAEAARLAERARVDKFYGKRQQELLASKQPREPLNYPFAVNALGPGFKNLYDVVGLRKSTPEELRRVR